MKLNGVPVMVSEMVPLTRMQTEAEARESGTWPHPCHVDVLGYRIDQILVMNPVRYEEFKAIIKDEREDRADRGED